MNTPELVNVLAADASPVDPARLARRFYLKLAAGAACALLAMVLVLGVRADLVQAAELPMFWMKLLFPASLALAALVALRRLGHPGLRLGGLPAAALVPLAAVWVLAGTVLIAAPPGERMQLLLGQTWLQCPFSIALLSLPALGIAFWSARELAPTRPWLAGAAAGLFAGAAAAFAYAMHCAEMQPTFLAVWYVAGMLIPTAAGALIGRRLLHW